MNVLIVGCGGREYAIAKKLKISKYLRKLCCIGSYRNPGLLLLCDEYEDSIDKILELTTIDVAIIGPESYLEQGIVDYLINKDKFSSKINKFSSKIYCIGPTKEYAQIETSKIFCRNLCRQFKIPGTLKYRSQFDSDLDVQNYMKELKTYVIKPDGLTSGKGVRCDDDFKDDQHALEYIHTLDKFLIEEKVEGEEFSLMSFCDGLNIKHMIPIQDFKRLYKGGPMTGGMGAISIHLSDKDRKKAEEINEKVFHALNSSLGGRGYIGVLYGSFMRTLSGDISELPKGDVVIIEYNARFGDPECINILEVLKTDLLEIFIAMMNKRLNCIDIEYENIDTISRYLVPKGYPDKPEKSIISFNLSENMIIAGLEKGNESRIVLNKDGSITFENMETTGSRTLCIIGKEDMKLFPNLVYRSDIGKTLKRKY